MKTLFITGGNSGIGYFMTKEWLQNGDCVSVLDLYCENVERLKEAYPNTLLTFKGNVIDADTVKMAVNQTKSLFGSVDYAVHNACLCYFKNFEEHRLDDFERVMGVNFQGAINLTRAVLPVMKNQRGGKICFTSSGVGVTGYFNISSYACSKGAIESLAKCLNIEYSNSGISFHIMHPPLTDTESSSPLPVPKEFKALPEKVGKGLIKHIDSKKFIITPSFNDALSIKFAYLFPISMGNLLVKLTKRAKK